MLALSDMCGYLFVFMSMVLITTQSNVLQTEEQYLLQEFAPVTSDYHHLLTCLEDNYYNLRLSTYLLMVSS